MNTPENNLITVFTHKEITLLYKTFLELVEDIQKDHQIMMSKVANENGEDFAQQINYFTPEKHEQIRKRVLDQGNECSRRLLSFLDFFDFTIDKDKVEDAAKQRRTVVKKVIINPPVSVE